MLYGSVDLLVVGCRSAAPPCPSNTPHVGCHCIQFNDGPTPPKDMRVCIAWYFILLTLRYIILLTIAYLHGIFCCCLRGTIHY